MGNADDNKKLQNVITMEDILGSTNEDQHQQFIDDEEDDDEVYRQ